MCAATLEGSVAQSATVPTWSCWINGCCVCIFSILSCLITVYRGVGIPWYYHVYNDVICYAVVACKPQHSLHTRDSLVSQRFLVLVQFPNSILFSLAIYIELSVLAILIVTIRRMWRLFSISMCTSKRSLLVCCSNLADYLPPSCLSWIQQPIAGSSNNTGCILISIQRVFTWTPAAISPVLNTTYLPVRCSSAELNTTVRTPAMFGKHTCAVVLSPIVFYCRCWIILFPLFQVLGFLSTWTMAMVERFHTRGNQTTGKYHLHCGFVAMIMCIWMHVLIDNMRAVIGYFFRATARAGTPNWWRGQTHTHTYTYKYSCTY